MVLNPDEQLTKRGRYVVFERYRNPDAEGLLDRLLFRWASRPLAAYDDLEAAGERASVIEAEASPGTVLGILDTSINEWIVYPKPRRLGEWRRARLVTPGR